jgi:ribosomal-protein-alanine N-acetyltransferase
MTARDYFKELPTLRTKRLILRKLTMDDAKGLFAYASDSTMTRYTSWSPHTSIDESRGFLAHAVNAYENGQPIGHGVVEAASGRLIGTCGISMWNEQHERGEVAWAIAASHWNQGYATEAARAVADDAFRMLPMNRLQSCCHVDNRASSRVMEKIGMTFEGVLRGYFKRTNRYDDVRYYSLLRDEWEQQTAHTRII